ncbi:Uncharacterized protein CLAVI_000287 [Candidatus Clavichlamydia salmonicola]|uniref:type III secretion T3S chaperone n=1 Tax=Candidatus Clavichlamydia salmonicola TaxID=469812 RepID=UPI001890EA56|nr:type III secretion T3S chaperone [Candidatus Clavichlamydia salmonicola]MBF5050672.1 Uncharacterized protein [Candidatus Clavichlamydia salmonicola]
MLKYPLERVLVIKKDRVSKAEKVVKEKLRLLEIEQQKLKKVKAERDGVFSHYQQKITQLRDSLDQGTTSEEVLKMKAYIQVVKIQLAEEEEKVRKQQEFVTKAVREVDRAKKDLQKRRLEEEKTKMHKEGWLKIAKREEELQEEKEQDEMGQLLYELRRRKEKQ